MRAPEPRTAEQIKSEAQTAGKRAALECGCPKADQGVFVNAYALGWVDGAQAEAKRIEQAQEEIVHVGAVS